MLKTKYFNFEKCQFSFRRNQNADFFKRFFGGKVHHKTSNEKLYKIKNFNIP
jgi:hypothetical protein